ncbi:T9SS type A sorting domain-containing protein [Crocinitomicaceae bacterium]|nr:T9SS type A sorting domain-containing protein [Crocinitomicaceae bacterium]
MRFLIVLVFVSSALVTFAQVDYFANNPEWNQASSCISDGCNDYREFVYYVNGDSTINSQSYKKFFKRGQSSLTVGPTGPECGPFTTYDNLEYLVRQDGYQVYIWNGTNDTLLYDFDVAIGDTFPVAYNVCDRYIVLDSLEQITFGGQQRRKFYFTETTTGSFSNMIEGVGWPGGFFEPTCEQPNCGYQFNCFSLNGQILIGTNCFFEASINEEEVATLLNIRPNPVKGKLKFDVPEGKALSKLLITDTNGRLMKTLTYNALTKSDQVPLNDISPGTYHLTFIFADSRQVRTSIVKL